LFAEITYYGSARVGFWWDITDEDHKYGERTNFEQSLQTDSHLGFDFTHGNLSAKVEIGFDAEDRAIEINYLWGRRVFRNWALVVGRDDFGSTILANQTFRSGLGLDGYGALDAGPISQVRFEIGLERDLFYIALMEHAERRIMLPVHYWDNLELVDPVHGSLEEAIEILIPRIMVGYNVEHPTVRFMPMAMLQAWSFHDGVMYRGDSYDDMKVAWIIAFTAELNFNRLGIGLHAHYGQNIGNMGFNRDFVACRMVGAFYSELGSDVVTLNTAHSISLGGHFTIGYDFTERFNLNAGFGFATTDTNSERTKAPDHIAKDYFYETNDERMAFYLQGIFKVNNFSFVPEFGMFIEDVDQFNREQGTQTYFGAS
jgi:hypothetical protein